MWTDILFDLDGTLTDPGEGITGSVRYAMEQMDFPVPEQAVLNGFVGPPLSEQFAKVCGYNEEQILTAVGHFREYFTRTGIHQNQIFPGIQALLQDLRADGKKLHLATTKPLPLAKEVLGNFGLTEYFTLLVGSPAEHMGRPKDEIVKEVLEKGGIDVKSAVMVGDRVYDVVGAHKNGLPCVGVVFGYGGRQELEEAGADYLAQTVEELRGILLKS